MSANIDPHLRAALRSQIVDKNRRAFLRAGLVDPDNLVGVHESLRVFEIGAGKGSCDWVRSDCGGAATGRPTKPLPDEPCDVKPPRCDCHVIGGNTLDTPGIGTATLAARFGQVQLDSGDAGAFIPYYMFVVAFQVGGANPEFTIQGLPLMVLLQDSRSGREPNMRRASDSDPQLGVATTVYGERKELECIDWLKFASTNNQQLTLTFYNPNNVTVHVFVDIWGIPAA
jgi:hypothetical protein